MTEKDENSEEKKDDKKEETTQEEEKKDEKETPVSDQSLQTGKEVHTSNKVLEDIYKGKKDRSQEFTNLVEQVTQEQNEFEAGIISRKAKLKVIEERKD